MKQQDFEAGNHKSWHELETAIDKLQLNKLDDFPSRYRAVCHQLAVAKHRRYSAYLVDRLNKLVLRSHHQFYQHHSRYRAHFIRFIGYDFPNALREHVRYVVLSALLFLMPGIIMFLFCYFNSDSIYSVMSSEGVRHVESMYDPAATTIGRERESDTDLMMFGFYIKNNISISFQVFAGGILFGAGSVFYLIYNGILIGSTAGHLTGLGFVEKFYPFVVGHGAFELTAIVFSGAAGLMIGFALIDPGPVTRLAALQKVSREAVKIIYGSTIMLLIAAFLEAFWSSSTQVPVGVKYAVGATFWCLVIGYCLFAGRVKPIES
ncbi:MAG: stage II sporulation protein M [Gammaproteobacteria bacterium]|jgi:uncharacterized membrane protein SpoIIM required for sporulation|nr:stage II sporulation protein M [Gammaproteobacteria bacterium]